MAQSSQGTLSLSLPRGVANNLPELREADYHNEVLHLNANIFEAYMNDLIRKATSLDIIRSSEESMPNEPNTADAEPTTPTIADTTHSRTAAPIVRSSVGAALISQSSKIGRLYTNKLLSRTTSKRLTFEIYDSFLSNDKLDLGRLKQAASTPVEAIPNLFRVATTKSIKRFRESLSMIQIGKETAQPSEHCTISCTACSEDIEPNESFRKLECGHEYCSTCLVVMITQATKEEPMMPPRCCAQPFPSTIIKSVLSREQQSKFLKAVIQFSTPWESRIFCSNPKCGEFIPPRTKSSRKNPFQVVCRKCWTHVCVNCKKNAHSFGQDCPEDKELDAVLKMGKQSGWRRCYKCRTLVELTQGCTHITCRCRAQFCYICGANWDSSIGCPNFCEGEEILLQRRREENARAAAKEAEEASALAAEEREEAERRAAEERTHSCTEFFVLRTRQAKEMERFIAFEQNSRWLLWSRHAQQKATLVERNKILTEKMTERHTKTSANLEDRQVAAEMELRSTLQQSEKNVKVRLKHMEAYCNRLGNSPSPDVPSRVVTEQDLRELDQQYNLEKNMQQLHQAKINVMRDQQAKVLEQLLERQNAEVKQLADKNARDLENLESTLSNEEDILASVFGERRSTLDTRWRLEMEIRRKELEAEQGVRYAPLTPLKWPQESVAFEDRLAAFKS